MLRSSAQSLSRNIANGTRMSPRRMAQPRSIRLSSSAPPKSGSSGNVFLGSAALVVGGVGGTLAYAAVDKDFRKYMEENVPGCQSVFGAILGEPEPEVKKPPPKPKVQVTSVSPSKKRAIKEPVAKKEEIEVKQKENPDAVSEPTVAAVPSPPLERPSFISRDDESVSVEEKKKPEIVEEEVKKENKKEIEKPESSPASKNEQVPKSESSMSGERLLSPEDIIDLHDSPESISMEKDLHKRATAIKEELESQMILQLKRQSEAHADHLNDALEVQRKELTRKYVRELDETLENAQKTYQDELAALVGHVRGLDEALQKRSVMDNASLEAQELWLACSALLDALVSDSTSANEVRSIYRELMAVRNVNKSTNDPYVNVVVNSIPESASCPGVYTEENIKERFLNVEKMARRTALIGEEGGSLFKYFLSYLQSLLVLKPTTEEMPSKFSPVDIDGLTTFDIVWLARGCLDRGDLEQAVRYMTLLSGEPRNVSSDWVKEARVLLETRQACLALMAHAAGVGVEALPQRK